jgi:hypothetical protein
VECFFVPAINCDIGARIILDHFDFPPFDQPFT